MFIHAILWSPTWISGPLIVVALVYEIIGILLGLMIKQFFWVPHRFRYGIILAGGVGNVVDLRMFLRSALLAVKYRTLLINSSIII